MPHDAESYILDTRQGSQNRPYRAAVQHHRESCHHESVKKYSHDYPLNLAFDVSHSAVSSNIFWMKVTADVRNGSTRIATIVASKAFVGSGNPSA